MSDAGHPHREQSGRGIALVALAALLLGGVLIYRTWLTAAGGSAFDRALDAAAAAGVELQTRDLPPGFDVPLEPHPSAGGAARPAIAALLAEHRIVLLNFWASWCPPCLDELPSLVRLAARLRPAGIAVAAVSYDDAWPEQTTLFNRLFRTPAPQPVVWLRDPQGQEGDGDAMMRLRLGTSKLPETYILIGEQVVGRFVGEQDWDAPAIVRALELLAEAAR